MTGSPQELKNLLEFGILGGLTLYLIKTLVEDLRGDIRALTKILMEMGLQSARKGDEISTELREIKDGIGYLCETRKPPG